MLDGFYQSIMAFFMVYFLFSPANFNTANGLNIDSLTRMGVYIATIAVVVANVYVTYNTYRWDWLMLIVVVISTLFIWFWTGIYTAFKSSPQFYDAAPEVYGSLSFWAVLLVACIVCLLPRFTVKAIQKMYFPLDVDIIREQVSQGHFDHLKVADTTTTPHSDKVKSFATSESSQPNRPHPHTRSSTVDEDMRPIYPPSVAPTATTHNRGSQTGSNSTDATFRQSLDAFQAAAAPQPQPQPQPRPRPSFDRARMSMDRMRPSFEASNDFTSAAMLARIESSNSQPSLSPRRQSQHRHYPGLTMTRLRDKLSMRRPTVTREEPPDPLPPEQ